MPRTSEKPVPLQNVRALVTTKWDRGYKQKVIRQIESFYLDSSLDNDADQWEIEIGDPTGEYLAMLERNNEVRIELMSNYPKGGGHLLTGIADELTFNQDGTHTISGRDYAALALDSTCPPSRFKHVKAKYVIVNQARKLGFPSVSLNGGIGMVKKAIKTDGSETYWEFWYRLYRNEKMYLWCNPQGTLIGNRLNYNDPVMYYFGMPMNTDTRAVQSIHIPVEGVEIRKSTQARVGEVWVYVHSGKLTTMVKTGTQDPTIAQWIKKPFKLIQDTESITEKGGRKKAWQEIYEGKVGSYEIRLNIVQTRAIIRPNRMCRLRIPQIGVHGVFFIVGTKIQAGPQGFVQEIRLREKLIALSRRVPHEPTMPRVHKAPKTTGIMTSGESSGWLQGQEDAILASLIPNDDHSMYADIFWKAAKQYADPWDFDTFLAVLLGITHQGTNGTFGNIREPGMSVGRNNIEWQAKPKPEDQPRQWALSLVQWQEDFVNQQGTMNLKEEADVGPMQLRTRDLKFEADDELVNFQNSGGSSNGTVTQPVAADAIDKFLQTKDSPMAGHGAAFVSGGVRNGFDPRMLIAMAFGESSYGKNCFKPYNAWGWLAGPDFNSWDDAISQTSNHLGIYYVNDTSDPDFPNGRHTVTAVGAKWAPVGAANDPQGLNSNWVPNVSSSLKEQNGNPNDITYKAPTAAKKATTTTPNHDQWESGRWDYRSNVFTGAKSFRDWLGKTGIDPSQGDQLNAMWLAVAGYKSGHLTPGFPFAMKVKANVLKDPGYLKMVKDTEVQIRNAEKQAAGDKQTEGSLTSKILPEGWPTEEQCIAAFRGYWAGPAAGPGPAPSKRGPEKFLQAKYYREGRKGKIIWIVIHTMENSETEDAAANVANMFATGSTDGPASAHYNIDSGTVIQSVHDNDTAYGVIGTYGDTSVNDLSLHFEHAGTAGQDATGWADDYSQKMLNRSAGLTALKATGFGVPIKHLTVAEIQNGDSGFVGHKDLNDAFHGGTHWDPGPDFPWAQYIAMVNAAK